MAVSGEHEKDIVLSFAQTLRARLVAGRAVRVMMIRDQDVFVPLDERVRIARAAGADLFVSIHADSITSPAIRGATLYTGAERATDLESAHLAERENAADAAGGIAPQEARVGVSDILQDLTVRETRGFSHRVAGFLHESLGEVTRFTSQPHREAGFRVLRAADMTSCLGRARLPVQRQRRGPVALRRLARPDRGRYGRRDRAVLRAAVRRACRSFTIETVSNRRT